MTKAPGEAHLTEPSNPSGRTSCSYTLPSSMRPSESWIAVGWTLTRVTVNAIDTAEVAEQHSVRQHRPASHRRWKRAGRTDRAEWWW
jgi:hypothetical protein